MKQKEKTSLIKVIRQELAKTDAKIIEYKELTKPIAPENAIGRLSRMDAINNKSVLEADLRNQEFKRKNLISILEKENDEEFGICRKCNSPIPVQRILIRPQSVLCVNCAR